MRTLAFIDASNLFYGGEKSLGWRIDYQKLFYYLCEKYGVKVAYYFGGIEICSFLYDYQKYDSVPLDDLYQYFMEGSYTEFPEMWRLRFFLKLQSFGYRMVLKPVKSYVQAEGKEVIVLARAERTAREMKQFAGGAFCDFERLRNRIEFV